MHYHHTIENKQCSDFSISNFKFAHRRKNASESSKFIYIKTVILLEKIEKKFSLSIWQSFSANSLSYASTINKAILLNSPGSGSSSEAVLAEGLHSVE